MRVCIRVAYDGSNYHGWQYQEGQSTIAGTLAEGILALTGKEVQLLGASRTDAGVHALDNVAVFDTDSSIPPERFCHALNTKLPDDIRVMSSYEVSDDFNPRFEAKEKTYEYRILSRDVCIPTRRLYVHYVPYLLDVSKMNQAAAFLVGEHDFTSFSSVHAQVNSFVRTIYSCGVTEDKGEIVVRVTGNGFLYNMVRIIAGTLLEVGRSKISPEDIPAIISAKDRSKAGVTLPPNGLVLKEIVYK